MMLILKKKHGLCLVDKYLYSLPIRVLQNVGYKKRSGHVLREGQRQVLLVGSVLQRVLVSYSGATALLVVQRGDQLLFKRPVILYNF